MHKSPQSSLPSHTFPTFATFVFSSGTNYSWDSNFLYMLIWVSLLFPLSIQVLKRQWECIVPWCLVFIYSLFIIILYYIYLLTTLLFSIRLKRIIVLKIFWKKIHPETLPGKPDNSCSSDSLGHLVHFCFFLWFRKLSSLWNKNPKCQVSVSECNMNRASLNSQ